MDKLIELFQNLDGETIKTELLYCIENGDFDFTIEEFADFIEEDLNRN